MHASIKQQILGCGQFRHRDFWSCDWTEIVMETR